MDAAIVMDPFFNETRFQTTVQDKYVIHIFATQLSQMQTTAIFM